MAQLGTAYVQIVPSAQGISGKIQKAIAPEASAAGLSAGDKIRSGMSSKLNTIGGGLMKAGAIATAVSVPIIAGLKKAMDAYQVQSAAETKLTEIYKTRMGATKAAAAETMKLGSSLQREGVVGDEVALSGAQQLATFAKYPSTVNSLMPAMENLLVQQKGLNGTTQDATQIANLMGKVMMGQTGALKRVGVSVTAAQEKVLKYGTEQEKAAMLSKVITQNVGNMNKAMLATPEGKIQQMKNSMGDLAEQLGAAVAPALANLAQFVSDKIVPKVEQLMNFLNNNPAIGKVVVGITGLLAVGGPLLTMIGGVMSKMGALKSVFGAIASPIGLVVAAFALAYAKSETFRNAVNGLVGSIGKSLKPVLTVIGNAIKQLTPVITQVITTIAGALAPVIKALIPVIRSIISVISSIIKAVLPVLVSAIKAIAPVITGVVNIIAPIIKGLAKIFSAVFSGIASFVGPIFKKIGGFITSPVKTASSTIKTVTGAISKVLKFTGLGGVVKKCFKAIGDFMSDPIGTAKKAIGKVIDKIRGWFPINLGKILSFKLPNVYKKTGKKKGEFAFGASWHSEGGDKHAKGGIFRQPTLLQSRNGANHLVGEASPEAILPLNTLWKQRGKAMEPVKSTHNNGGDVIINLNYDANADASDLLRDISRGVKRYKMAGVI